MASIPALVPSPIRRAFTLVELLVVIGIITLLIGITIPVVSKIRLSAQEAASQAIIAQLQGAIETYKLNLGVYPGPIPNNFIYAKAFPGLSDIKGSAGDPGVPVTAYIHYFDRVTNTEIDLAGNGLERITMAENLLLGLAGGLFRNPATGDICFDPTLVGTGARSLGQNLNLAKSYDPLGPMTNLFRTKIAHANFQDDSGSADDSEIPEFVDAFGYPMPILYLRANLGRAPVGTTAQANPVVTYLTNNGPYDLNQIISYTGAFTGSYPNLTLDTAFPATGRSIGVGKKFSKYYTKVNTNTAAATGLANIGFHGLRSVDLVAAGPAPVASLNQADSTHIYSFPLDAFAYFDNPNQLGTPRQKDGYILISAGRDRVYGSQDDLTNFGSVVP